MIELVKLNFDSGLEENQARLRRARVEPLGAEPYLTLNMLSVSNGGGRSYTVALIGDMGYCSCPDFKYRGSREGLPCKHLFYVHIHGLGMPVRKEVAQPVRI